MKYIELVKIYEELEETSGRLDKVEILSKFLKKTKDLEDVVHLLQGRVFSRLDERKIGMSSRLVLKVISKVVGVKVSEVEKKWREVGDLGKVVEELKKKQSVLAFNDLTVKKVVDNLRKLSELEGKGSISRKIGLVVELLNNSKEGEGKFIVRTVLEDLRIGVAEGVLRDSISKAFDVDVEEVERAYNVLVDYGEVSEVAKEGKISKVKIKIGKPLKVMLAVLVKNVKEAFESVGKPALFEEKIDGFRVQVHKSKEVKLFTRRMEDVSKQFPDVIEVVKKNVKGNCILDCEIVGIDKGKHLPFQKISQRIKRKYDIEEMSKKFPVELNVFDVMFYEKSLIDEKLKDRRKVMKKLVKEEKGKIVLVKSLESKNVKESVKFFDKSIKNGLEGLMIKNLDSKYKAGRYVNGWVKLKEVLEPLDLVVVGAEYGKGKRSGWLSSFDLACRDGDEFLEIGKVGTGIKEKSEGVTFEELTKKLKKLIVEEKGRNVKVKPELVLEINYEEIQKSSNYGSGYGLRFPRVIRIRDEKDVSEINTLVDVENIYRKQKGGK